MTVSRTKTVSCAQTACDKDAEWYAELAEAPVEASVKGVLFVGALLAELAGEAALFAVVPCAFFLAFSSSRILSISFSRLVFRSSISFFRRVLLPGLRSRE